MDVNFTIKLDEVFAKLLTDPFSHQLISAISSAAECLDKGEEYNFDFDVFDPAIYKASQQRYKPPTSTAQSSNRMSYDDMRKESLLAIEPIIHDTAMIPIFYNVKPIENESEMHDVVTFAEKGVNADNLGRLLLKYCRLPRCFASILLKTRDLTGKKLISFWNEYFYGFDPNERLFKLITDDKRDSIFPSDLAPFVRAMVDTHPSLSFLKDEVLFQEKFIEFIITRCFYQMDSNLRGTVGLKSFRKINLARIFLNAERMADLNDSHHIFNYQHFYVTFCRFYDLDSDNDGFITKDDLMKFNEYGISPIIIERFFDSKFYPRSANRKETIDFTSFTYFLISCEDKMNATSINFWYKLCDLEDDGVLSMKEMETLYNDQLERMRITGNETIRFDDIIKQLMDMVDPIDPAFVTTTDLIRSKMSDVFFNSLFDLQKFLIREYQFPLVNPSLDEFTRQLTPWDIYVLIEYDQLINDTG